MSDGHSRVKFSIRQLMIAIFFLALCSLVAAAGNAGDPVAYGLVLGAGGLVVSVGCMALFSGLAIFLCQFEFVRFRRIVDKLEEPVTLEDRKNAGVSPHVVLNEREHSDSNSEGTV